MKAQCFVTTPEHLRRFLQVTGNNWRGSVYLECCHCPCITPRNCHDLLCAFDEHAQPVIIPVHDAEYFWDQTIDKSECLSVMSTSVFKEVYGQWLLRNIQNPHECFIADLRFYPGGNTPELPIFVNL